jgi:hypothetical protein
MATIQEVNSSIIQGQFSNEQLDSIIAAVKFARNQIANKNKYTLRIGTEVKFTSNRTGQTVFGIVEKVNRKFIIVREKSTNFYAMQWRVPANMLEAA